MSDTSHEWRLELHRLLHPISRPERIQDLDEQKAQSIFDALVCIQEGMPGKDINLKDLAAFLK